MNVNGQLIEALTHSPLFQNYECAYTEATGLPIAKRPFETWQMRCTVSAKRIPSAP